MEIILLLIGCGIMGVVGMAIGDLGNKKNGPTGFLLGALLGPIGWIIVSVLPPAGDADVTAQPPADSATQRKINILEAQLAELKGVSKAPAKASMKPMDDDASIPTYKLD